MYHWNLSWSQNLEADCPVVPPLSKPRSVPVLPCCHRVMAFGIVSQCGAIVRYGGCHNPLSELSVRLPGRNQTFTAGAPAAVVLLPQLINNGHPIVARHGRTGSRIGRNSLNPATSSALLPYLPRNCEFRFLVGQFEREKCVGPAWGKPVKAWQCDLQPAHVQT